MQSPDLTNSRCTAAAAAGQPGLLGLLVSLRPLAPGISNSLGDSVAAPGRLPREMTSCFKHALDALRRSGPERQVFRPSRAAPMAAAMAQPRPITPPTGAAPTHEVWEVAEPPLAGPGAAPLPLPRTIRREGEAAAAARAAALAAQAGARPAVAPLPLPRALRREGPPLPR